MSGKRRRSWEKDVESKSGRPCWEGNRNFSKDDDISRDRDRDMRRERDRDRDRKRSYDDEYRTSTTTRLPYRERDGSRSRSRGRDWGSGDDRHKSTDEYDVRNNSRPFDSRIGGGDNLKENWGARRFPHSHHGDHHRREDDFEDGSRRHSKPISQVPCRFFAVGKCYRDDCKFSHHLPNSQSQHHDDDHDNIRDTWHASEKKKPSWDGPSWGDVESHHKKKKPCSDDDIKNGPKVNASKHNFDSVGKGTDGKTDSWKWNGPLWGDEKVPSPEQQQLSPKNNNNQVENAADQQQQEEENVNPEEEAVFVKSRDKHQNRSRSPFRDDRHKSSTSNEYHHARNNNFGDGDSRGDNLKEGWTGTSDYTRNRNSRNHYHDDDDDRQSNRRISKIHCRFFAAGNCTRDDCRFSHDYHDTRSHPHASDYSEKNNMSWNGPLWDEVDEKPKPCVQTDDDNFLPQQQNDSHLNNGTILSEEANQQIPQQNLTISKQSQDTRPKHEGNDVMEDENPKRKHDNRVSESAKQDKEKVNSEKVKEGNIAKCMRHFRSALVECVKEILKPKWKEGKMTREVHKTVVKKVVDKITTTIQDNQIPTTQAKIEIYLTHSKPKIMKLVEAYVDKLVKA